MACAGCYALEAMEMDTLFGSRPTGVVRQLFENLRPCFGLEVSNFSVSGFRWEVPEFSLSGSGLEVPDFSLSGSGLKVPDFSLSGSGLEVPNFSLSGSGLEVYSRGIVGSAEVFWVDIHHDLYLQKEFLSMLDSRLRLVKAIQSSLNDWLELENERRRSFEHEQERRRSFDYGHWRSLDYDGWRSLDYERWRSLQYEVGRSLLLYSLGRSLKQSWWWSRLSSPEEPLEDSIPSYAVVVSAVVLLSLVYHYLTGNVDRGGSKAYSRSSLDFRDIYIAIVLFLGAYVWIKFREVAFKGVHPRKLMDKQGGIKVVYAARLTPPMWNGRKVPKLDLGQFATPQEAHNKFLIAAFYYNRDAGLLDGWYQVPPMSEEERSLTGLELREWVIVQAKEVYEDFKKQKAETALLLQEFFEPCEDQVTPEQDEVNVDPCGASLLNSAEHQQAVLASQAENSGMGMAMLDNHGLECASHSLDGMHEGLALSNGHGLGAQEGSALPVSQLPPNIESGMSLSGSDQLGLLPTLVRTLQQQISDQQQQISGQQQQISGQQQQISGQQQQISGLQQIIQGLCVQMNLLQQQRQRIQQQPLQESRIQNPQWPCQFCLQQQQLQDVDQGFVSFEVEMEEQSMQEHIYSGLMAPPPDRGEVQEGFSELDTLMDM